MSDREFSRRPIRRIPSLYIQKGKITLTVVSTQGKEAVVAILGEGAFFGDVAESSQYRGDIRRGGVGARHRVVVPLSDQV
jgi:hypothetical protein